MVALQLSIGLSWTQDKLYSATPVDTSKPSQGFNGYSLSLLLTMTHAMVRVNLWWQGKKLIEDLMALLELTHSNLWHALMICRSMFGGITVIDGHALISTLPKVSTKPSFSKESNVIRVQEILNWLLSVYTLVQTTWLLEITEVSLEFSNLWMTTHISLQHTVSQEAKRSKLKEL
jgi:hypothetical protein